MLTKLTSFLYWPLLICGASAMIFSVVLQVIGWFGVTTGIDDFEWFVIGSIMLILARLHTLEKGK